MAIWSILLQLVYSVVFWYILRFHIWYSFSRFGMFYPEKSGNPGSDRTGRRKCEASLLPKTFLKALDDST
jgi:hypothetical protein